MSNLDKILVSCQCAPNIALIKYWGKSNEELILPLNGSISVSLDRSVLCANTSLLLLKNNSSNKNKIKIWLNKSKQEFDDDLSVTPDKNEIINQKRFLTMLNKVRSNCSVNDAYKYDLVICSANNFPTACGLASSASGFACLAHCLSTAFDYNGNTSELARLGSGSACRSCFGGFVKWSSSIDSSLSVASPLFSATHWPELNILVLVLEDGRKDVSSTNGMRDTVRTSELLKERVRLVEEKRLSEMEEAIRRKDFEEMAKLTMVDSNCFHACCMDTYPPLFYLNDKSKGVIKLVNDFNKQKGGVRAAYSFDAGPNAFLFTLDESLNDLVDLIYRVYFGKQMSREEFQNSKLVCNREQRFSLKSGNIEAGVEIEQHESIVKYVLHSKVGSEPLIAKNDWSSSLLDDRGEPK